MKGHDANNWMLNVTGKSAIGSVNIFLEFDLINNVGYCWGRSYFPQFVTDFGVSKLMLLSLTDSAQPNGTLSLEILNGCL